MGERIGAIITTTVSSGPIYALLAVGFVLVYRATKVVSFAQGAFTLVGGLFFLACAHNGLGFVPALLIAIIANLALGGFTYRAVFARMEGAEPFVSAMATIGLAVTFEAVGLIVGGSSPITVPNVLSSRQFTVTNHLTLSVVDFVVIGLAALVFLLLFLGFGRSRIGLKMRAVADVPKLAAYSGVNVTAISTLAWGLAAGTAAVAGIAFMFTSQPAPSDLYDLGLAAFPAILLGGFDSILGALIGGILLALIQAIVVTYAGGEWQDAASYGMLLLVMLVRPQGLFGSVEVSRV
jgi:branched-chain amino acid transport system permease protein